MIDSGQHFWRGFSIALMLLVVVPVVLTGLAMVDPTFAMVYAYLLAPVMIYLYPAIVFLPPFELAWLLALTSGLVLAVVIGFITRHLRTSGQWLATLALLATWWITWRLVALVLGVVPALGVRM